MRVAARRVQEVTDVRQSGTTRIRRRGADLPSGTASWRPAPACPVPAWVPPHCVPPVWRRCLRELGHSCRGPRRSRGRRSTTGDTLPPRLAGTMRNFAEVSAWTQAISSRAYELVGDGATADFHGRRPCPLDGHRERRRPSCQASRDRELFVLWIDAHADYNTPFTSPSGNMHGMPVAALVRRGRPCAGVRRRAARTPVDPTHFHMIGIRSIDTGERTLLRERGVNVMDMRMIDEFGIARLMRPLIETVQERNGLLHVSLDVDFIDPSLAPGVGTVVPGGANFREAHLIMEMLHDSGLASSLDIVELNPFLDDRGKSAMLLVDLVASLFGRQIIDKPSRIAV